MRIPKWADHFYYRFLGIESIANYKEPQTMTFSTSKIGTIEEVKEHLRSHHAETSNDSLHVATHQKAREAAISEVEEFGKRGHTHVQIYLSGHTYTTETGHETVNYGLSVNSVDSDEHGARVYNVPKASPDLLPE